MTDMRQIDASAVARDSIIVTKECAVGLIHLAMLTEDRTDEEHRSLLKLAACLDIIDPGNDYVADTLATRDEHG